MAVDITPYTFMDAERLRYGRYPVLDTILYRWARRIEQTLFEALGVEVYAGASVFEEMRFSSFFATVRQPRPIYFFELPPLQGQGLLVTDNRFAAFCLRRGAGEAGGAEPGAGRLSPENQRRVQAVVQRLLGEFDACWADIHPVEARLTRLTTYPFRARILQPYEPCLVAQLHLSGSALSSRLTWCLPRLMLDPLLETLGARRVIPSLTPERAGHTRLDPERLLRRQRYRLPVRVGELSPGQLAGGLKVGAVLPLEAAAPEQATLELGEHRLALGALGAVDDHYALRVERPPAAEEKRPREAFRPLQWPEVRAE